MITRWLYYFIFCSKNNISNITGKKTFTDLEVADIYFNKLNGVEAENIVLKSSVPVHVTGSIVFEQLLKANNVNVLSGKLNNEIALDDIVPVKQHFEGKVLIR